MQATKPAHSRAGRLVGMPRQPPVRKNVVASRVARESKQLLQVRYRPLRRRRERWLRMLVDTIPSLDIGRKQGLADRESPRRDNGDSPTIAEPTLLA